MLDAAPPAHEKRRQTPRYAIREQKIDVFLRNQACDARLHGHVNVIRLQYSPRLAVYAKDSIITTTLGYVLSGLAAAFLLRKLQVRLQLSGAKHRSLAGHSRMARLFAGWVPFYEYGESQFFRVDSAPADVAEARRAGFLRLSASYAARFEKTAAQSAALAGCMSDLEFTSRYRVPFQFSGYVRQHLQSGSLLQSSSGVSVTDLDGNHFYDLTGSYGVNVFGYDFYKECIERGSQRVRELGPVLGAYHPVIAYNVRRLLEISRLDEISFHMSGTEAVMQAVGLARYHTGRTHLVRFCGAYHGWWGDVQPGVGNPIAARETYTLQDMDEAALQVLRKRRDIACVLINPLQALHPNTGAPGDSTLVDSGRNAGFDRAAYSDWLKRLRAVCSARGIVLIFDEVFVGFRLALGGAQEYFGVPADMVTYGKTVAGGLPVGVLCGKHEFMRRFRSDRPADICFARGTFNSHPYVMGAMYEFLAKLDSDAVRALYQDLDALWDSRAQALNDRLAAANLPVRVASLSTIWTIYYARPSRYNWMFQYYLRAAGLALSWVGTGRLIFSLNYTDADFAAVAERIVAAAEEMQRDGWWWSPPQLTNRAIRRRLLKEMLQARWSSGSGSLGRPPASPIGSISSPRIK
jgi:glutamate-1-semialdehyde 2,1-aminomutase